MGDMSDPIFSLQRIGKGILALAIGSLTGATLTVIVLEARLSALPDMIERVTWIARGRPLAQGYADAMWFLEAEMWAAFWSALIIAFLGAIGWAVIPSRSRQSFRSAALLGFVLSAAVAALWFSGEPTWWAASHIALIGLMGAIAGAVTRAVDQILAPRRLNSR